MVATVVDNRLRSLFEDLCQLRFDADERRPPAVNLTDILEVEAVVVGVKPDMLMGRGSKALRSSMSLNISHDAMSSARYGLSKLGITFTEHRVTIRPSIAI